MGVVFFLAACPESIALVVKKIKERRTEILLFPILRNIALKENFTEHNPSATIYVGDNEWVEVGNWVYQNWDIVGGLSFLPRNNHVYKLAPYEEIDGKTYRELSKRITNIDFSKLPLYESQDNTQGAKEYACVAGGCEA